MIRQSISSDWFFRGPENTQSIRVNLPHDYSISQKRDPNCPGGPSNGFFPGGDGTYIKYLRMEPQHTILQIDGAYMCAEIFVNGDLLAMHPHGYAPFLCDITDRIIESHDNKLKILTHGFQRSTRWYSGSGLYRDVFLWTGGDVRIEPWDLFITTESVQDGAARMHAAYTVSADQPVACACVRIAVLDPEGREVCVQEQKMALECGKNPEALDFQVQNAQLWDPDHPVLYTLKAQILLSEEENAVLSDETVLPFGIRTISADAKQGFRLNGKSMKLKGGCIHHDHGVLGAASYPAAEERKIRRLKEAGFNAVRIAHNPPSTALLEVCDRLGMLVMDEAFDMWNEQKGYMDYHLWFRDWWQRDIRAMVLRDRTHPCVISYSIGNEIREREGSSDGYLWAGKLAQEVRLHDNTRFVTAGIPSLFENRLDPEDTEDYAAEYTRRKYLDREDRGFEERMDPFMSVLDMAGYNYIHDRYPADHQRHPDRVFWSSETKALYFYDSWKAVEENPYVLGDFTWTCYDNMGEAGTGNSMWARDGYIAHIQVFGYPWRTCYQGDHDLCGYRRPQSYFREAIWNPDAQPHIVTEHPEHFGEGFSGTDWHWYDVHETWTFDDCYIGKPVKVQVYTTADEVVFALNGREIAHAVPEKAIASAVIPYEKGTLTAAVLRKNADGSVSSVQQAVLKTVGPAAQIQVKAEPMYHCVDGGKDAVLTADQRDLAYFAITVTDREGNRVDEAEPELTAYVSNGELMGIYSGNPANEDEYTSCKAHAFHGRALAVVRTAVPGKVQLLVTAEGLASGTDAVTAQ